MSNALDIGTFTYGDEGTDFLAKLVDEDGEPINLNGASAMTLECRSPGGEVLSIAGLPTAIEIDGEDVLCGVTFENLGTAAVPTTERRKIHFEAVITWTQAAEPFASRDRVRFAIELFP